MNAIVIGIDGTIGAAVAHAFGISGVRVIGTTRRRDQAGSRALFLDLNNPESVNASLPGADVAIFCAALTRFSDCRARPDVAQRVNATVPAGIARRLAKQGVRVVLLSTSAVFDCREPHMSADRDRAPTSIYGRSKADAELAFLDLGAAASILRLTKTLSPGMPLISGWIESLSRGESVQAFSDLRIAPITIEHVVRSLSAIAGDGKSGIYQASAADDISYAVAAQHIAARLGKASGLVRPCSAVDFGIPPEEVAAYTSLDTSRLSREFGFVAPQARAVIDEVYGLAAK